MIYCKSASVLELATIAILGTAIHFRIDMNDATSTIKGLGVLAVFLLVTRLLKYDEGFDFIRNKARNYRLPSAVTVIFVVIALFLGIREIHASMMIHKAKAAIANKDYPTYISAMISCADFVPNPAGAYFDLANAQLLQKDTEEALKNYQKSLNISYTDEAALVILQRIADAGEETGWQKMLNHLIETYPEKANFKLLKAQNLISEKNYADAEKYLNEVLNKDTHDSAVLITLGNLRVDQNRLEEAKKLFEEAHKANPADGSVALASYYRWTEDYANSEKFLAEAIEHFPLNATLHVERGVNFAIQNDLQKAIESWEKALQIDPELEAAKRNLAIAKAQLDQAPQNSEPRPGPFRQNIPEASKD
jgi:tetratricopeptide (TPR) repeat protein